MRVNAFSAQQRTSLARLKTFFFSPKPACLLRSGSAGLRRLIDSTTDRAFGTIGSPSHQHLTAHGAGYTYSSTMDTKRKVEESIALLNSLFAHPAKKLATGKQTLENTTTGVVSGSTAVATDATQPTALENIKRRSFLPPRPAVLDKLSRLAASRPTLQDSIAASIAASAPTAHAVATSSTSLDPFASTTATTTSTISSLATKPGSFKSDKKRYLPWSRDQFHERLETFKPSTWFDKPKLVNAVECAKHGWINKGNDRLECYGGCGGVVIVTFDEMRDFSTQIASTTGANNEEGVKNDLLVIADESCNMDEDQLIPELDTEALGPKFHAMLTNNHTSSCPWKSHPCDDSIYKFPVVPLSQASQEWLDRIGHLKNMASDPLIDKIRHPLSSKQVADLTHMLPEPVETKLAILSLFGWTAAENQKVLICPACHTQCTFVPSYGSSADQLEGQKANTEAESQQTGDSSTETPSAPIVARMEMNIAKPMGTEVTSVAFSFYDAEEIKQISVKQIVNPVLFDNLNHPTKGGLYDPALGPFSKHHVCATCSLDHFACPGHFGHIELPCPVYNPMFFPQMYQMLRSSCLFCHHFRMSLSETHRFIAKLQLLNKGRFLESKEVDNIPVSKKKKRGDSDMDIDGEEEILGEDEYVARLEVYVRSCLKKHVHGNEDYKTTVVNDERKRVIAEFYRRATAKKKCEHCASFSPTFRKDGYAKIFEKPLSKKHAMYNTAQGREQTNVLAAPAKKLAMSSDSESASEHTEDEDEDEDDDANMSSETDEDEKKKKKKAKKAKEPAVKKKSRNINDSDDEDAMELKDDNKYLTPLHIRNTLRRLFEVEQEMCALLYGANGPKMQKKYSKVVKADIFFLEILPVAPTRFRPASVMGDKLFENPQNEHLGKILNTCERLRDLTSTSKADEASQKTQKPSFKYLIDAWIQLQHDVNSLIDSTKNPTIMRGGKLPPAGIRQGLEKKEGLFRKHMMGKRVNYAARSVISPDVNIETNEIGIPPVFATKLTYPEPVTHYNVKEMRRAVINGPSKWPGAAYVQHEDGALSSLANLSLESRIALANQLLTPQDSHTGVTTTSPYPTRTQPTNKKVYRHLRNGDLLLLNRQPTLHKPSIMAHKARILPGERTIRMHYANCNTYNADFDGDEMNVHFPQNEIARAEAKLIANTDSQYLVPTSGAPLRGLIQDHVVAGVWMTIRGTFFSREEYQHLLYGALRPEVDNTGYGKILTLPPTVWKPVPLWTGKDVITAILHNLTIGRPPLNMTAGAQVKAQYFGKGGEEESIVQIMDGVLVTGVLDKAQFGAKSFGLVHSCYEIYGGDIAGKLLSILGRLFTRWTQRWAFTCRMDDLRLTPEGDNWRRQLQTDGKEIGTKASLKYAKMDCTVEELKASRKLQKEFKSKLEVVLRSDEQLAGLDATMKSTVNELTTSVQSACIPNGLLKKFPHNNMQTMTVSGAKGSYVNVTQISCALGQQELEGRRVPIMVSGKSLPSFAPFDSSARAGGYIAGRFLTGIRPQEYYFHCMAGREGLIDTAVKTSRSGYLQRCLIKHLEGLKVGYDQTVRDSDGSILQFHYGEDSLDVIKQAHINQFKFSAENSLALIAKYRPAQVLPLLEQVEAMSHNKKVARKPHKYDPTLSLYSPSSHVGAVSEAFEKKLNDYMEKNPDGIIQNPEGPFNKKSERYKGLDKKKFRAMMYLRYMNSLVEPGEAVGLLAAQGVGEPSTQMTLNTFHFAGFGAKNVTLGIPRLREIVMTASTKLKTPTMTLNINPGVSEERLQSFCQDTSRLTLAQLIDNVQVTERLISKNAATNQKRHKVFAIRLNLFREDEYKAEYGVSSKDVERVIEAQFVKKLESAILKDLRRTHRKSKGANADDIGKPSKAKDSAGGDADDDDEADASRRRVAADDSDDEGNESDRGDGDAASTSVSKTGKQQASYDEPDSDDEEVIKSADKAQRELDGEEDSEVDSEESDDSEDEVEDQADKRKREARKAKKAAERNQLAAESQKAREERICSSSPYVKRYSFDTEEGSWCEIEMHFPADIKKLLMVNLVTAVAPTCVVHEIKGIDRVFMSEDEKGQKQIATEGVNLKGIWEYADLIDVNSIYSNDIGAILRTYGVEAARSAIIQEISGVFGAYGIDVDRRHLTLIADYMTFESGFKPFNRMGIESSTSPFLKMSFERTCHFLTQATLHGDYDGLESPSARLVMGKVVEGGTGAFDVMQPLVPEAMNV
ncbi:hypothetical protein BGZ51_002363 [Haplosporangium sp. Z 767]|nr:hypothetical protein BGZ51_002363 [Haplosporangium sp. Z 767]